MAALVGSFDFKPAACQNQDLDITYRISMSIVGGLKVNVTAVEGW
jgi:hypothetical protein